MEQLKLNKVNYSSGITKAHFLLQEIGAFLLNLRSRLIENYVEVYEGEVIMTKKALLIIDVQNDMFQQGSVVHNGDELLQNINSLITQARSTNTPVFYIQHNEQVGEPLENGTYGWQIHSDISPLDGDVIIQKTTPDSFFKTTLDEELRKQGVEHLYLSGIQTEICVDTTCRSAFSKGYKVTLVSDSHSTWNSKELTAEQIIGHHNNTLRWFADIEPSGEVKFND